MIYLDTETYSEVPITHGTYKYAANCEVMVVTYAFDDGPAHCWDLTAGEKMPGDLEYMVYDTDEEVCAQGAMFDRNVTRLSKNLHLPIAFERWRCTIVQALSHSLPGGLEKLCTILKVPVDQRKLDTGKKLIHLFCKPQAATRKVQRATRFTHPAEWKLFLEYATQDITAMRAVHQRLPKWNYRDTPGTTGARELALWQLDQRINDRGICVDVPFATAAIATVKREQARLKGEVQERTGYDKEAGTGVESAAKRDQLLAFILEAYGVDLPDMQKSTLERRQNDPDLPIEVRKLIGLRLESATTSTTKYNSLVRAVSSDGRLRGTKQFNGAQRTGRWAGRVFQPDNLPRPKHKQPEIEEFIEAALADCADLIFPDDVMGLASSAIRGCIIAPTGRKLIVSDLSNIEGRVCAWLGGAAWKLQAFRAFDAKQGPDLYNVSYANSFNIDPADVTKDQRQIGKVSELMLQYEGGVGAWVTGAATYKIDLEKMAEGAYPRLPFEVREEAEGFLKWTVKKKRSTFGLSEKAFVTCDTFKRLWRGAHPGIVELWPAILSACVRAVEQPGNTMLVGALKVDCQGVWLRIRLPSGRCLCYPNPQVSEKGELSYSGVNQYTRKWQRVKTYGGKLVENITQAIARDVLAEGMMAADAKGYEIVLTVHDEIIAETPDAPDFSIKDLAAIMSSTPAWAAGLPLAAAGFEAYRYKKE